MLGAPERGDIEAEGEELPGTVRRQRLTVLGHQIERTYRSVLILGDLPRDAESAQACPCGPR